MTLLAPAFLALTGCGDSSPDVPFNPAGTSADIEAVNATFGTSTFADFSSLSVLFDAAYGDYLAACGPVVIRRSRLDSCHRSSRVPD